MLRSRDKCIQQPCNYMPLPCHDQQTLPTLPRSSREPQECTASRRSGRMDGRFSGREPVQTEYKQMHTLYIGDQRPDNVEGECTAQRIAYAWPCDGLRMFMNVLVSYVKLRLTFFKIVLNLSATSSETCQCKACYW